MDTLIGIAGVMQSDVADVIAAMKNSGYTSAESGNQLSATVSYTLIYEHSVEFRGKKEVDPHEMILGVFRKNNRWRAEIDPRYRKFLTPKAQHTIALDIEDWAESHIEEVASERKRLHERAYPLNDDEIRAAYEVRKVRGTVERAFTFDVCKSRVRGILRGRWRQGEFD